MNDNTTIMRQVKLGVHENQMFYCRFNHTESQKENVSVCFLREHCPVYQTAPVMFMSQQQGIGGVLVSE